MRRKWGSCTSRGTITLAVDLADQALRFQDFVIVHELLHLRYLSHGKVFKALLNAYVPGSAKFDVAMGQPAMSVRPVRLKAMSGSNRAS
jgi:predicted metal-dependent hydrolase